MDLNLIPRIEKLTGSCSAEKMKGKSEEFKLDLLTIFISGTK
jgi:hypothetical protein